MYDVIKAMEDNGGFVLQNLQGLSVLNVERDLLIDMGYLKDPLKASHGCDNKVDNPMVAENLVQTFTDFKKEMPTNQETLSFYTQDDVFDIKDSTIEFLSFPLDDSQNSLATLQIIDNMDEHSELEDKFSLSQQNHIRDQLQIKDNGKDLQFNNQLTRPTETTRYFHNVSKTAVENGPANKKPVPVVPQEAANLEEIHLKALPPSFLMHLEIVKSENSQSHCDIIKEEVSFGNSSFSQMIGGRGGVNNGPLSFVTDKQGKKLSSCKHLRTSVTSQMTQTDFEEISDLDDISSSLNDSSTNENPHSYLKLEKSATNVFQCNLNSNDALSVAEGISDSSVTFLLTHKNSNSFPHISDVISLRPEGPSFQKHSQNAVISQVGSNGKLSAYQKSHSANEGLNKNNLSHSANEDLNKTSSCSSDSELALKCGCSKKDDCTCQENIYHCAYCQDSFPSTYLLQKHTFNHIHPNNKLNTYNCTICNLSFPTQLCLEVHARTHKKTYCGSCDRSFKLMNLARHDCNAEFLCDLCGRGFTSNSTLRVHMFKHSAGLPYKCNQCIKSFAKPFELNKHNMTVHLGERPFKCDECGSGFSTSTNLRNHKNTHLGVKPYSCHVCQKNFTRPTDVKRHLLIHSGTRPFPCRLCGMAFADASNLRKHEFTHTKSRQQYDVKTYSCSVCEKPFSRPSELKRHFFTHGDIRPHSCPICGLAFTDSSNLKKHVQTHSKDLEHRCPHCEIEFDNFVTLESHIPSCHKAPSGSRVLSQLVEPVEPSLPIYRCEICSKNFCQKAFLLRHLLTHTESRPFSCSICFKLFKTLSNLRSHSLIHTGHKSHVCLLCNKSFLKKSSLIRHQAIHAREKVHADFLICG